MTERPRAQIKCTQRSRFLVHTFPSTTLLHKWFTANACHCRCCELAHTMACSCSWWPPFAFRCCFLKKQPAPAHAATRNIVTRPSGTPHSSLAVTTGATFNTYDSANFGRSRSTRREAGGARGDWRVVDFAAAVNQAHRQREGHISSHLRPKCTAS